VDIKDITPENIAKAVNGTIERGNNIVCCCPIHEASGTHNPSLVLTITSERRVIFHCRSQNCDRQHFAGIRDHLVKCGLPRSHVGAKKQVHEEIHYPYFDPDGNYVWTKVKCPWKPKKQRFSCAVYHKDTGQWSSGRPEGAPRLFNLDTIKQAVAMFSVPPLLIVEGEKDALTAGQLGVLATTCADGAGSWRAEDTQTLIRLGIKKAAVCPDNDGPGTSHGVAVAKSLQQASVEVKWLELPDLGVKEDLSDWTPRQTNPDATLHELIETAPLFDAEAHEWKSKLKVSRPNAGNTYPGHGFNMSLALQYEPRLRHCFAWNEFRQQVEVTRRTPWCQPEWWEPTVLTPIGHRALQDADIVELGSYLTGTYDFGACATKTSREAIHAVARRSIFDEAIDWIGAHPDWDGNRRDNWLVAYAGADTTVHLTEYLTLVGMKFIMQVLNRGLHPGAKADYSLVFNAGQGFYKDLILGTMFAPYYREGIPSPNAGQAEFALGLAGALVAHDAEMSAWRKADVEKQKAALTRCVDHGRRAYGYEARSYPRRACIAFSTNDLECLHDTTGDRRYWVVSIIPERVDIEGLRRNRDQLLAEALHRLQAGERHWPTPEEEARLIEPERQKFMPEAALEIVNILQRFVVEDPQTTRPNRDDFIWKWTPRPQPLSELYLDRFFGKFRDVGRSQASRTRPSLQEGHRLLHDMAPQEQVAPGRKKATGRTESAGLACLRLETRPV
jgi:hypothetical protein